MIIYTFKIYKFINISVGDIKLIKLIRKVKLFIIFKNNIYKPKPFPQHVGGGHVMEVTITHTTTKTFAHSQHFNQLGSNTAIHWRPCMANTKYTSGSSVEGPGSFHWFTPSTSLVQQADPTCTASVITSLAVQVGRTLHWSRQFMHSQSLSIHSSL